MTLSASYPGDAIGGADFLTGAAQRDVIDVDSSGREFRRREKIVITDRFFDGENVAPIGRACFSEQTIRMLGAEIGLFDANFVAALERQARADREQIEQLKGENLRMKGLIAAWEDTAAIRELYIADDGTTHPTSQAATEHMTGGTRIESTPVQPLQEA